MSLLVVMVLSGCQTPQATEIIPTTLPPKLTDTTKPKPTETPVSTEIPPTETPTITEAPPTDTPLPTKTPTETATPLPPMGPEQPATSIEEITGRWLMKVMGGGEGDPAVLTLAEDGTHSIDAIGGYHAGMNLGTGTYWFDGDIMYLHSMDCTSPKTEFFECTATYRVYVSMGDDGPGKLRFVAIDDPHPDRKLSLNNKKLYPAPLVEE
ncbi:MAG: hypothetical protein PVF74_08610 [Anaerolineales bacterium]